MYLIHDYHLIYLQLAGMLSHKKRKKLNLDGKLFGFIVNLLFKQYMKNMSCLSFKVKDTFSYKIILI